MQIPPALTGASPAQGPLLRAAQELETGFLAEMLRAAGLGATSGSFGGGPGEEHFRSFLVREQAQGIVRAGGVGLTDALFRALTEVEHVG